jgi:hypothetical protein
MTRQSGPIPDREEIRAETKTKQNGFARGRIGRKYHRKTKKSKKSLRQGGEAAG